MRSPFFMRLRTALRSKRNLHPTRFVASSFGVIILVGALLLTLPISSKDGQWTSFLTGIFTATSATCVTGLVVVDTWTQWTVFGQGVILALIQMGGLGFMTVITLISLFLHRRISLSERLLMGSALNLNDINGVVRVVRHALIGTCLFEGVGAVILATQFIPQFGFIDGLWRSIFHSISAFCNAGFDLMGSSGPFSGIVEFYDNPVVLLTIMALIVIGGLGFFVWEDVLRVRCWSKLSFYSKMVFTITGFLIVGGLAFFLVSEWSNPATLGTMTVWQKWLNALFQSVTLRTAGFNTINQGLLVDSGQALSCVFMLIGGSSGSTAGGIKTVTAGVLFLALRAGMHGKEDVSHRGRTIPQSQVMSAFTLTLMVIVIFLGSSMVLSFVEHAPFLHAAFEIASAMGTVGLSTGLTPGLTWFSQVMIILLMFTGRVGIMSFSLAFVAKNSQQAKIKYPTCNIMIG